MRKFWDKSGQVLPLLLARGPGCRNLSDLPMCVLRLGATILAPPYGLASTDNGCSPLSINPQCIFGSPNAGRIMSAPWFGVSKGCTGRLKLAGAGEETFRA